MGWLADWTQLRKEPLSLRIYQYKLPKLKSKDKRLRKKWNRMSRDAGTATKSITYMFSKYQRRRKRKRNRRNIWWDNDWETIPILMSDTKPQRQEAQRIPSRINVENKTLHLDMANANCRKLKIKKKSWSQSGGKIILMEEQK